MTSTPPSQRAFGIATCAGLVLGGCVAKSDPPRMTVVSPIALEIPCDAHRVLQTVCQQCHSAPPRNSAPFPLVTYDDTQAASGGKPIWTYMRTVVQNGIMPLPPVQITSTDRDTLLRWLNAGAPPRTASDVCSTPVEPSDGGGADGAAIDSPSAEGDSTPPTGGPDGDSSGATDGQAPDVGVGSDSGNQADAAPATSHDACTVDMDASSCE